MNVLSRSFRLTWRGGVYLALMLAVGYAALYKGNNLLFAVFSTLAGLFVASLILTLANGRRLEIQRLLPNSVHANQAFSYILRIQNRKRLLPTFCVKIEDPIVYDTRPAPVPPTPVFVPTAAPRERVRATVFATAYQRGHARFNRLDITSEFPPGFFTYRTVVSLEDKLLIYPRDAVLQHNVVNRHLSRVEFLDLVAAATTRGSEAFAGVREYRPGDNPRWIHWKLSARAPGRMLVKEFEDTRVKDAVILLETFHPNPADIRRASRLERAICFTAALAEALLAENYLVRFRSFTPDPVEIVLEPRQNALADLQFALASLRASRTHAVSDLFAQSGSTREEVYFLLRIGEESVHPPFPRDRVVEIHADAMRSMMYYTP